MPLDRQIADYLQLQKGRPTRSSLTVEETRDVMREMPASGGVAPEMTAVDDTTVAGVRVRCYRSAQADASAILVYFHGGRFFSGGLDSHDTLCRWIAADAHCVIMAVDYRLAPEFPFPAAADDAVNVVRAAASNKGVRVGVSGDSAGGNLAAVAAREVGGLSCQVLVYPMLDAARSSLSHVEFATGFGPGSMDMERGWALYAGGADRGTPRLSPFFQKELAGMAPALVLTAEFDSLRDEGELYAERMRNAGVEVELRRYSGMIHGFFGMPGLFTASRAAIADVGHFVRVRMSVSPE